MKVSKTIKPALLRATIWLVGFIILLTGRPTQAATLYVNTAVDESAGANCSLREAVHAIYVGQDVFGCTNAISASGTLDPYGTSDTINIPAFTISLFAPFAFAGTIQISNGVTIQGAGYSQTIIDGSNLSMMDSPIEIANDGHISGLTIQNSPTTGVKIDPNASLFLSHVRIMNTGNMYPSTGGCIDSNNGSVELVSSELKGCKSSGTGGGINFVGNSSSLWLFVLDTTIHECVSMDKGGGISLQFGGSATILDSTLANNTAQSGAGLFKGEGVPATLQGVTIAYNENTQNDNSLLAQGLHAPSPASALFSSRQVDVNNTDALMIQDSIVANNSAFNVDPIWRLETNCGIDVGGGSFQIVSGGYNILGNPGDDICPGEVTSDIHADPKFVTNAGNYPFPDGTKLPKPGGVGPAYVPVAGSPALSLVPSTDPFCSTYDERSFSRSNGNKKCDIGAVSRR